MFNDCFEPTSAREGVPKSKIPKKNNSKLTTMHEGTGIRSFGFYMLFEFLAFMFSPEVLYENFNTTPC
jgi:hypothetical protein